MWSDSMIFVECIETCGGNGYLVPAGIKCELGLYHDYLIVGVVYKFGRW